MESFVNKLSEAEHHHEKAIKFLTQGNHSEAIGEFEKAIFLKPEFASVTCPVFYNGSAWVSG